MTGPSPLVLDLALERVGERFRAHIVNSPFGQAESFFQLAATVENLEELYAKFSRAPGMPRQQHLLALQEYGLHLFERIFADEVGATLQRCRQLAKAGNIPLHLTLRLSQAPELQNLAWELLFDGNEFLALSTTTPLSRYLEAPQSARPLPIAPPIRVLVILSNPLDYEPLDVEEEWMKLQDALADVQAGGLFIVERLEQPTLAELQIRLRRTPYHILHFSGHAAYSTTSETAVLIFQDAKQRAQPVSAAQFGTLLQDASSLRLVFLNACEAARGSAHDAFAGVAQALIARSIPAAISNQFALTDEAATIFARALYAALADGSAVDVALTEARKAIFAGQSAVEWATPVLYTHTEVGSVFELGALSEAEQKGLQVVALKRMARLALDLGRYERAIEYAHTLKMLAPTDREARQILVRATHERTLPDLYSRARASLQSEQWQEAMVYLRQIQGIRVNYQDVDFLVEQVERQLKSTTVDVRVSTEPTDNFLRPQLRLLGNGLLEGRVIFILGADVNGAGRPQDTGWVRGRYTPNTRELAEYLIAKFGIGETDPSNLVRVSQYISTMLGAGPLNDELHEMFDADYPPTPVHIFLAKLPALLRAQRVEVDRHYPLIITTNYDDMLERTFDAAGESYDLLTYIADGEERGNFRHLTPAGTEIVLTKPNEYEGLDLDERPVIVKIHGTVDRMEPTRDSFVITEDHYIDYLIGSEVAQLIPTVLLQRLVLSHILFLGYSLREWNLRILLRRIWNEKKKRSYQSWAIQPNPIKLDLQAWNKRDVELIDLPLDMYVTLLAQQLNVLRAGDTR